MGLPQGHTQYSLPVQVKTTLLIYTLYSIKYMSLSLLCMSAEVGGGGGVTMAVVVRVCVRRWEVVGGGGGGGNGGCGHCHGGHGHGWWWWL